MLELLGHKQYHCIVAKCWADAAFKQRLWTDPAATLKAEGIDVPDGVNINLVENVTQATIIVIPPPPTTLTDGALDSVTRGGAHMVDYRSYQYDFM